MKTLGALAGIPVLAGSLALMPAGPAPADQLALVSLPEPAQKMILDRVGTGRVEEINPVNDAGLTNYEVTFTTKAGASQGFTVGEDGALLCLKLIPAELPPNVLKSANTTAPGWKVVTAEEDFSEGPMEYNLQVAQGDQERGLTIAPDGHLVSRELDLTEAPEAVRTAVPHLLTGGQIKYLEEDPDPDGTTYYVEAVSTNGVNFSFSLTGEGKVASRQVFLAKLLPAVRRTIRLQAGDGKIIRIDQLVSETVNGVHPYEVTARKNGKLDLFLVGPYGRFLGRED